MDAIGGQTARGAARFTTLGCASPAKPPFTAKAGFLSNRRTIDTQVRGLSCLARHEKTACLSPLS